jgi:hypothetical protein
MGLNLDIDGWLRGIGLEQYAQTFRDNAIDADVLCDLTDEHLRELGLPLGVRLKLLRAVAALSTGQSPFLRRSRLPLQRASGLAAVVKAPFDAPGQGANQEGMRRSITCRPDPIPTAP